MKILPHSFFFLAFLLLPILSYCQYFGQNKPKYQTFHFQVAETNNFEIYHYLPDDSGLESIARQSEQWYAMHLNILKDSIASKTPFILYNNHPEFQQTNTTTEDIEIGTGGFTEALKRRMVLPIAGSNQQTNHVIGHELVHAFQFNMLLQRDSVAMRSFLNIPLWMMEGMAEFLSIGRYDAMTCLWLHDAAKNKHIPTLKDLQNTSKYFPYRYGHAFWAFISAHFGDDVIAPLFIATAKYGIEEASQKVLHTSFRDLSEKWVSCINENYSQDSPDSLALSPVKNVLIDHHNGGKVNLGPSVSPNGQFFAFFSEKDLFSYDLFLAETGSGKIIRKLAGITRNGHLDDYYSLEAAGTWSPDSKIFATVAIAKGRNIIVLIDISTGKTIEEIPIPKVPAFSNPTWSPDGLQILFSGNMNGQNDLFTYHFSTRKVTQLTNDVYSELHPSWSPDGSSIVYTTDEISMQSKRTHGEWTFNLKILDLLTDSVTLINPFPGSNNINPLLDKTGNIYFLSNQSGINNLYYYNRNSKKTFECKNLASNVTGISTQAPALSLSHQADLLLFSTFINASFQISQGNLNDILLQPVIYTSSTKNAKLIFPDLLEKKLDLVNKQIEQMDDSTMQPSFDLVKKPYKQKFKLDYVGGGGGIGIGVSTFGPSSGIAGGVDFLFSDILGNQQLYAGAAINGQIYDFAAILAYVNRKYRIQWGTILSHIPQTYGSFYYFGSDTLYSESTQEIIPVEHVATVITRQFQDRIQAFGQYQFSRTFRIEGTTSFNRYSYRIEQFNSYLQDGIAILEEKEVLPKPAGFNLASFECAAVGDNTFFGIASPAIGHRFRFSVERFTGKWNFWSLTADARKYFFINPFTLAFRALHFGHYGPQNVQNEIGLLYIGNPVLVRGFNILNFTGGKHPLQLKDLVGSKLFAANAEFRIPFSGPKRLALIPSNYLLTELAFFLDAGFAWYTFNQFNPDNDTNSIRPIFSTGLSLRINLFGAIVLEPYYAIQLKKDGNKGLGINFIPGW